MLESSLNYSECSLCANEGLMRDLVDCNVNRVMQPGRQNITIN
jgi:hypothetical protein